MIVKSVDLTTLAAVLRRNTESLEAICQRELASREAGVAGGAFLGALSFPFLRGALLLAGPVIGGAIGSALFKNRFLAEGAAAARDLSGVLELASQYNEHSSMRISNKQEFEMLLAKADRALALYHRVFVNDGTMLPPAEIHQ